MELLVTDRQTIERGFLVRSAYALISIRDPGVRRAKIPKSTALRGVLHLAFHDAEPTLNMQSPPDVELMTEAQAREIWQFVDQHKADVGAFVVHCHQGMSRSHAVAAAVAAYLGKDDRHFWQNYMPNRHVHRLLRETMPKYVPRRTC